MSGFRLLREWCIIATVATLLVLVFSLTGWSDRADNALYDRLISARAPSPSDEITIIAIDNRSLQALGRWPWPRYVHTKMLTQLAKMHPKTVSYDVLFNEPSADDALLAGAIKHASPVYLPLLFEAAGPNSDLAHASKPAPLLAKAAAGLGHVNVRFDSDGLVRSADVTLAADQQRWPHLMIQASGRSPPENPVLPIAFQPRTESFRTASFIDVLNGEVPDVFLRNKRVLVGAMGDGMGDQFPVPITGGGLMYGIDLQANMLNTILAGVRITILPRWASAIFGLIPLWILLGGFWRWRPRLILAASLLLVVACAVGSAVLMVMTGVWLPPVPALIGLLFASPVWGWRRLAALTGAIETNLTRYQRHGDFGSPQSAGLARADQIAMQVSALDRVVDDNQTLRQSATDREHALQMLSHDMRAPQASIITLLESEGKGIAAPLAARLTSYARRTLTLADNFVQLARVNETRFTPEVVNLSDLLHEAVNELYPLYKARNIRVVYTDEEHAAYIMAEPALLIRVLMNVLDNAIKYSPDGGTITCRTVNDGQNIRCSIADKGSGMTADQVDGLFVRFSPVGGRRNTGSSGSGLGLTLVDQAMVRHGGSVNCTSQIGNGTEFTLLFPAVEPG